MFVDVHNLELLRLYITVYIGGTVELVLRRVNKSGAKASWRLAASLRSVTSFNKNYLIGPKNHQFLANIILYQ